MPAKSTLNETPPAVASDNPSAGQNPDLTVDGRQPDADPGTSSADGITSATERLTAERTERRRQRAAARETPARPASRGEVTRRERPSESTSALARPTAHDAPRLRVDHV